MKQTVKATDKGLNQIIKLVWIFENFFSTWISFFNSNKYVGEKFTCAISTQKTFVVLSGHLTVRFYYRRTKIFQLRLQVVSKYNQNKNIKIHRLQDWPSSFHPRMRHTDDDLDEFKSTMNFHERHHRWQELPDTSRKQYAGPHSLQTASKKRKIIV